MWLIKTIAAAFSMFSAVPMPDFAWDRETMRYMLCAFPLVGLLIGFACWAWYALGAGLGLPDMLMGLGFCLIPVLVTGGIHLDGYCDTWDAISSHKSLEKKREILKDPHIGAFAAMHLVLYLLLAFVFWTILPQYRPLPVLAGFFLSRSLSALAVAVFPLYPGGGLAHSFADLADRKRTAVICGLYCAAAVLVLGFSGGICMVPAAAVVFLWYRFVLVKEFGGLSGDLAGWFLQEAELWMLIALYVGEAAEGLL